MKRLVSTLNLPKEDWLRYRKCGITGTDAGAILGLNPYRSAFQVYHDKISDTIENIDNEAMRQGRDLEDYVAQRFSEETGFKVRRANAIYQSEEHPLLLADFDRLIVGQKAGLECKTVSPFSADKWADGKIPAHYLAQVDHYLAVSGFDCWYVAALIFGRELVIHKIVTDKQIQMAYKALAKKYHPDLNPGQEEAMQEKMKDLNEAYEILSDKDKRWQYNQSFYQNEESSHYSESEPQRNSWTESSYRAQAETASQGSKTTSGKGCARTGCGCLTVFIVIFMFMGVVGSFSLTKENKSASASEVSTAASMNDQSESRTEETMPISNETKASSEIQNGPIYNSVDPPDSTDSRQEILVEATGSNAMLTLWTYRDGQWVEDMSTTAAIGSDGLTTNKTEGDHMTPEGTFPIYFAFSTKAKNTKIAFETISEDSVWVCDPESVYYNTLQSKNNPDKDWTDKGGAENMYPKFSKGSSNACICFGFNGDGWSPYGAVAYGGSALFIDGVGENGKMNSGYGDIKISGKDMTKLLSYLDSDYNPTITIRAAQ